MYARIHQELLDNPFRGLGVSLLAGQAIALVLALAFFELSEHWPLIIFLSLGIAAVYLALRRNEAEQPGDRFLMFGGTLPAILFLYVVFAPLGMLAMVIWGIVFIVSIVI